MPNIANARIEGKPSGDLSKAMQAMHDALCELIRAAQVASPFEHVGQVWAKPVSQNVWCEATNLKLRTFQELVKVPPIRRYQCNLPGGKVTLLRIGDCGAEQHRVIAKQMAAYYCAATKEETVSRAQFGMLCGLARNFPDPFQMAIFMHTLRHWPDFMDDAKVEIEIALAWRAAGLDPFAPDVLSDHLLATARRCWQRDLSLHIYRRPHIDFLLAFWPIAVELFIDHCERNGGAHPARIWHRWSDRAFCAVSIS